MHELHQQALTSLIFLDSYFTLLQLFGPLRYYQLSAVISRGQKLLLTVCLIKEISRLKKNLFFQKEPFFNYVGIYNYELSMPFPFRNL